MLLFVGWCSVDGRESVQRIVLMWLPFKPNTPSSSGSQMGARTLIIQHQEVATVPYLSLSYAVSQGMSQGKRHPAYRLEVRLLVFLLSISPSQGTSY
jgi:hypothetical protein